MGLQIKKLEKPSNQYVNNKTLADYPVFALRMHRSGEGTSNAPDTKGEPMGFIIGDFVALDSKNKVVMNKHAAMWTINHGKKKDGERYPHGIFRFASQLDPGEVGAFKLYKDGEGTFAPWVIESVDVSAAGIKAIEAALEEAPDPAPAPVAGADEKPWDPWAEKGDDEKPPF